MESTTFYRDIGERCGGNIYIGVVGPVRTGKSTLIARLMELLVLPHMEESHSKDRMVDELPQSGSGKSIMTTQPRFVPSEAVALSMPGCGRLMVRLVDCVGFIVPGALGSGEEGEPRMVRTPWMDEEIPFAQAAELGTRKVIDEHSTLGLLVTTDGSIADLPRENYVQAEENVVEALKASGKPFVLVLNSAQPDSAQALALQAELEEKYAVPTLLLDVLHMDEKQLEDILGAVLYEFPLRSIHLDIPSWLQTLDPSHPLMASLLSAARKGGRGLSHVREYARFSETFDYPDGDGLVLDEIALGTGEVNMKLAIPQGLFYRVLGEACGAEIRGDAHLMGLMGELMVAKREYDRIADALASVRATGYGLVPPLQSEMRLEEPELVRGGGRYGVRLKASGPSLHLMNVDISTVVSPLMGTERESEELVKTLLADFEEDPARIWETNLFGRSISDLVEDGLANKLMRMPEDVRDKMKDTLAKVINEGSGGVICILL